jgi:7-cyano-7-deazaguanine synthase in queuosine biosynthesis
MEEWPPVLRIASNILIKKSQTTEKGKSSSLGLGEILTSPYPKTWSCYEKETCGSGLE